MLIMQALKILDQQLSIPGRCFSSSKVSMEDILIGMCLASGGVRPIDSRDRIFGNTHSESGEWIWPNDECPVTDSYICSTHTACSAIVQQCM